MPCHKIEHDHSSDRDGEEHHEGELLLVRAKSEALQRQAEAGNVDVEHIEHSEDACHRVRHWHGIHVRQARRYLIKALWVGRGGDRLVSGVLVVYIVQRVQKKKSKGDTV